jgi:hypothetical protein
MLAEHPFGMMKGAFNQGYLFLKGLGMVKGEVGFMMLSCNMRRVINYSWCWCVNGFNEGMKKGRIKATVGYRRVCRSNIILF